MSLTGRLEDVSVVELLQFVHVGGRSGTLRLRDQDSAASVSVHRGRTIGATGPNALPLGPLLIEAKLITAAQLAEARARQAAAQPRPSLDKVLVDMKAVTSAALLAAVEAQIKTCIYDLISWTTGTFDFDLGRVDTIDDLSPSPGDTVPPLEINTQATLLEGLQRADERAHEAASATLHATATSAADAGAVRARDTRQTVPVRLVEVPAPWRPSVFQIVSKDVELARQVGGKLAVERVRTVRVALADAGAAGPDEEPPVVLLDLRAKAATVEDVTAVRRAHPRALVLALPPGNATAASLYAAGATAVVGPDAELLTACTLSLLDGLRDSSREVAIERGVREGFARVHHLLQDLRSGLLSSSLALSLMAVVSESVERAVLFLVRPPGLKALGAFGAGADGRSLAEVTRDLMLPLNAAGVLVEGFGEGRTRILQFDERTLPVELAHILGPPRTGQAAVFPVLGGQGLIAVLYVDNGTSGRALSHFDSIEIATAQVGMAFENQLLRKQLAARLDGSAPAEPGQSWGRLAEPAPRGRKSG